MVIVALHGYGDDPSEIAAAAAQLDPTADVLVPVGSVVTDEGPAWFEPGDPEGMGVAIDAINQEVDRHLADTDAERRDAVLLGFSQGASVALSVGLTGDREPVAGVLAFAGFLTPSPRRFAWDRSDLPPVFLASGRADGSVPLEQAHHAVRLLQRKGVALRYYEHDDAHVITSDIIEPASAWLHEVRAGRRPSDEVHSV